MGMPITTEIIGSKAVSEAIEEVFSYFVFIDETFSPFKTTSEVSRINRKEIQKERYSQEMKEILRLSEQTKNETKGYFNIIDNDKKINPSGLVKGWSILKASELVHKRGYKNFYIEAGGDIQVSGQNKSGKNWLVGIRNPFNSGEIIKSVRIQNQGIATSGTYQRGQHIYNPYRRGKIITEVVSLTVIAENVYEADRFATAAFAMGEEGINFIERLAGLEGYMIDKNGIATLTSGFNRYISNE